MCVTSIFTAACAGTYEAPQGPTATLTIQNEMIDVVRPYVFREPESCAGKLGIQDEVRNGVTATMRVAANRPFTVGIPAQLPLPGKTPLARGLRVCTAVATFVPREAKYYVADFRWRGDACTLTILERLGRAPVYRYVPEVTQRLRPESACQ